MNEMLSEAIADLETVRQFRVRELLDTSAKILRI
jgi:hypothetical protein